MSSVLRLIEDAAGDFGAYAEELAETQGIFALPLVLPDGSVLPYRLQVTLTGTSVTVREATPHNLPAFCPQRHINRDGTFCLYWSENGSFAISSAESATQWWEIVWKYLTLQARAENKRRWPNTNEWAHGKAALHQKNAMAAAERLGPYFYAALDNSAISIELQPKRSSAQGPTLRVLVHGQHIYSIWLNSGKVVNRKQRCFCGSSGKKRPARLRSCQGHAKDAADLALRIKKWQEAESEFWESFKEEACCGTCDDCPLQEKLREEK